MKNTKPLKPRQLQAVKLLAAGFPKVRVAKTVEVSVMTLSRWAEIPEYQAKLNAITTSGMEEIAKTLNATAISAVETLSEVLNDMSQPVSIRVKAALGVLGVMSSVNTALERGLQHRTADFDLKARWNSQGHTYDQRGEPCSGSGEHTIKI